MLDLRPSYGSPDVYFIKCCYRSDPEIESQWFDSSQSEGISFAQDSQL
jgi:hypothetical protein